VLLGVYASETLSLMEAHPEPSGDPEAEEPQPVSDGSSSLRKEFFCIIIVHMELVVWRHPANAKMDSRIVVDPLKRVFILPYVS
jgi:hypothetical protein